MRTQTSCLDHETLAAFVDGRLEGVQRQAAVEHLADCEACYEVLVEAVRLREAVEQEDAREGGTRLALVPDPEDPEGAPVPLPPAEAEPSVSSAESPRPRSSESPPLRTVPKSGEDEPEASTAPAGDRGGEETRRLPWKWGTLAAALAVAGLGLAFLWPALRPKQLSDTLSSAGLPVGWAEHEWPALTRSGAGPEARAQAFRAGAHHLDLEVALANDQAEAAITALHALRDLPGDHVAYYRYRDAEQALEQGLRPRSVRRRIDDGKEQLLRELEARSLVPYFRWGAWVEAGRLAVLAGDAEPFRSSVFREDGEALLASGLGEPVNERIRGVLAAAGSDLDAAELASLERSFSEILQRSGGLTSPRADG